MKLTVTALYICNALGCYLHAAFWSVLVTDPQSRISPDMIYSRSVSSVTGYLSLAMKAGQPFCNLFCVLFSDMH